MNINLETPVQPKCKNCGKESGKHKAFGMNCPFGRIRNFPNFYIEQFFEREETAPPRGEKGE